MSKLGNSHPEKSVEEEDHEEKNKSVVDRGEKSLRIEDQMKQARGGNECRLRIEGGSKTDTSHGDEMRPSGFVQSQEKGDTVRRSSRDRKAPEFFKAKVQDVVISSFFWFKGLKKLIEMDEWMIYLMDEWMRLVKNELRQYIN